MSWLFHNSQLYEKFEKNIQEKVQNNNKNSIRSINRYIRKIARYNKIEFPQSVLKVKEK